MPFNVTEIEDLIRTWGYGSAVVAGIAVAFIIFSFEQGVGYLVRKYVPGAADPVEEDKTKEKDVV